MRPPPVSNNTLLGFRSPCTMAGLQGAGALPREPTATPPPAPAQLRRLTCWHVGKTRASRVPPRPPTAARPGGRPPTDFRNSPREDQDTRKLPDNCSPHVPESVPGQPGELRSCPRAAPKLLREPASGRMSAKSGRCRAFEGRIWPKLAEF